MRIQNQPTLAKMMSAVFVQMKDLAWRLGAAQQAFEFRAFGVGKDSAGGLGPGIQQPRPIR